ncbi:hypothetical protein [Pseudomonas nunensis]|uniref:Uncharacterized protein n=1 Tax=Pseudomonas nunensis TaxID=2961896 RepID=A0ABY5EIW7_9PSED|nr:hypothetical protein [Pseudomonas nunensis]MCL5228360.1 hypothetical protein [Pseudomonas nunensis]UTO14645.1 hypothetical protein NK667_31705 [Pseudomonas nunensis]
MKTSRQEIQNYFESIFGARPEIKHWAKSKGLPFYLLDEYAFHTVTLFGREILVLLAHEPFENAAKIRKHIDILKKTVDHPILYATGALKSFERKRLIESGVEFVVPGNQLFAPQLGLDLREFYRSRPPEKSVMSPASQALLIAAIIRGWDERYVFRGVDLAGLDQYSKMTTSRAMKEFQSFGLIEPAVNEKSPRWRFVASAKTIWDKALPALQSPVKRAVFSDWPPLIQRAAGLSALSKSSLLEEPPIPVIAFTKEEWDLELRRSGRIEVGQFDHALFEVEIWSYSPDHIRGETCVSVSSESVDPLSLFLSLRDSADDRVQISLDEMMEKIEW